MSIEIALVMAVLSAAFMSGYTTRVAARGPQGEEFIRNQSWFRLVTGMPTVVVMVSTVIWGLIYLPWYWVVGGFLAINLIMIPVLFGVRNRSGFAFWYTVQPILDLAGIAGAVYIWFFL